MNIKILPLFLAATLMCASCSSTKKTSYSSAKKQTTKKAATKPKPAAATPAKPNQPVVTIREEKVQLVDSNATLFHYYVILGSFKDRNNAQGFQSTIAGEGYTSTILNSDAGFYRISVGGYDDEQAARNQIATIRASSSKYGDVWLLKVKQ
jgi:cell division protein FtsN